MKISKKRVEELLREAYIEYLLEAEDEEQPDNDDEGDVQEPEAGEDLEDVEGQEEAGPETVMPDATDEILEKFPTLKQTIIKLMSQDFEQFVEQIDWISPRPTAFKINLTNAQNFILTWQGDSFVANVMGKNFDLSKISEFQQALDKLAILYRQSPVGQEEDEEPADTGDSSSSGGSGGGDFPGGEGDEFSDDDFEETGDESPEGGPAEEPQDLGGEEIEFEDGAEP